jgi:hypothetical protein
VLLAVRLAELLPPMLPRPRQVLILLPAPEPKPALGFVNAGGAGERKMEGVETPWRFCEAMAAANDIGGKIKFE